MIEDIAAALHLDAGDSVSRRTIARIVTLYPSADFLWVARQCEAIEDPRERRFQAVMAFWLAVDACYARREHTA